MRPALEDLLRIPDEAPEVDWQLHPCLAALADLMPQDPQVLLQLQIHTQTILRSLFKCSAGATASLPT